MLCNFNGLLTHVYIFHKILGAKLDITPRKGRIMKRYKRRIHPQITCDISKRAAKPLGTQLPCQATLQIRLFPQWLVPKRPLALRKEWLRAVVLNLGPPDVLGLQLPEILARRGGGVGFWELQSKNIWRPKVGDHWLRESAQLVFLTILLKVSLMGPWNKTLQKLTPEDGTQYCHHFLLGGRVWPQSRRRALTTSLTTPWLF